MNNIKKNFKLVKVIFTTYLFERFIRILDAIPIDNKIDKVCKISTHVCFLKICGVCPGIQVIIERLKKQLHHNNIQKISTDMYRTFNFFLIHIYVFRFSFHVSRWNLHFRCFITKQVVSSNEFLESLEKDWPNLLKHAF